MSREFKAYMQRRQENAADLIYGDIVERNNDGTYLVRLIRTEANVTASKDNPFDEYVAGTRVKLGRMGASGLAIGGGLSILGRADQTHRALSGGIFSSTTSYGAMSIIGISPSPAILEAGGEAVEVKIYGYGFTEAPTYSSAEIVDEVAPVVTSTLITLSLRATSSAALGSHSITVGSRQIPRAINVVEEALFVGPALYFGERGSGTIIWRTDESFTYFEEIDTPTTNSMWFYADPASPDELLYLDDDPLRIDAFNVSNGDYTVGVVSVPGYRLAFNTNKVGLDFASQRIAFGGFKTSDSSYRMVIATFAGVVLWESAALTLGVNARSAVWAGGDAWFARANNQVSRINGTTFAETAIATPSPASCLATDGTSVFVGYSGTVNLVSRIIVATSTLQAALVAASAARRDPVDLVVDSGELFIHCRQGTAFSMVVKVTDFDTMAIAHELVSMGQGTRQLVVTPNYVFASCDDPTYSLITRYDRADLGNRTAPANPTGSAGLRGAIWL